jgi:AraC-like DNA-binding protein
VSQKPAFSESELLVKRPRRIPLRDFSDYAALAGEVDGIFIGRFEVTMRQLPNRHRLHRHDYFEIFCLEGGGSHFNDFEVFPITSPTLVFVTPGQVHQWHDVERLRGWSACFTQEFFDGDSPPPSPLLKHAFWYPSDTPPVLALQAEDAGGIEALFADLEREFVGKAEGYESALGALLRVLFVRAERLYLAAIPCAPPGHSPALAREFRLVLERHFRTTQSVSDYARLLGVSADHLSQVIHQGTGKPAGEIIRQRILLEAQRLLSHTEMSVSEVAYSLNFQDPAYFSRFFRRLTGHSPGEFRSALPEKYRK